MSRFRALHFLFSLLILAGLLSSCEIDTQATGIVRDAFSKEPLDSVRVIEFAVQKKDEFMVADGYTDSTGRFDIGGGLFGGGPRKTRLVIVVDKEGYTPTSVENFYTDLSVELIPHQ
ncbi:MAG: hypothetical protein IPN95_06065 [Bacteroidetes bacterium]|nr:hypothetical protein [Bacteroidota bacterium]